MKNIFLLIALFAYTFINANTPIILIENAGQPINAVIGDQSYFEIFGEYPNAEVDEQTRIRTHLKYVEALLRQKDDAHLTEEQCIQREKLLDLLHEYWTNGVFPENDSNTAERKPVFIDHKNNVCAVGYLVQQTAGNELAKSINQQFKYSYIPEIKHAGLSKWVEQSGLSLEECAMIQPTYIIPEPTPQPRPIRTDLFVMELRSNQVNTKITGQSATTSMDQVFYNPSDNQFQGYYIFPIPKGASIDHFSMFINGKETEGELLDAEKARKIYEDIVRKMQDPALLEYYNNALFRVRIFPIQPRSEQRVKLTYTQTLSKENGTIEYIFPFKHQSSQAKTIGQASFKIDIEANGNIKTLYCPTHEVEIIRKGAKAATIGFEGKNIQSVSDFKLYYNTDESKIGASLLSYNNESEDGYFFLNISPGFAEKQTIVNKDITFVLDCSGSMAGEKMDQAKKALQFCIENLNKDDRFNIVRFSTESNGLFDDPQQANKNYIDEARKFIESLKPIGGTNIDEALAMAMKYKKDPNRPYFVVFLTDGKPTIGETNVDALLKKVEGSNPENTRIFTFGIGTEINTYLLDKLTEMTQAYRTYVTPDEDIEIKVSDFYTKIASPILTDLKIEFDKNISVEQIYPKQLQDLFKGSTLTLFGRYKGNGKAKVFVSGKVNEKTEKYTYELHFDKNNTKNEFIPALWGSRAVGYLLDQIRLNGETKELKDEVIRLAKKHGIITPYTSYLILEDEMESIGMRRLEERNAVFSNRTRNTSGFSMSDQKANYDQSQGQSGAPSIEASEEIQEMGYSDNVAKSRKKKEHLKFKDDAGNDQNLADGIVNIQGRAVYQNGNEWVDAKIPLNDQMKLKTNRIKFNSVQYFKLLKEQPESIEFLALGRNVRFVLNETVYEIFE